MGRLRAQIDVARQRLEKVEVLGEGFPLPGNALVQGGAGDVFDAFHQFDQAVAVADVHRGEADAAIAHDGGGHTVPAGRRKVLVPGGLAVVVGVDIDEAGRNEQALGIDLAMPAAGHLADLGDPAVVDGHVGLARRAAAAVDDRAAANDERMRIHGCPLA